MFFGGWTMPLVYKIFPKFFGHIISLIFYFIKITFVLYLFFYIRAAIPRYRYDQLMKIGWKVLLPVVIFIFCFNAILVTLIPIDTGAFFDIKVFT